MSLSSTIVFDLLEVYTEKDTRTREVFIIGVSPLGSRDEWRTNVTFYEDIPSHRMSHTSL